jgi:hypothetical protein
METVIFVLPAACCLLLANTGLVPYGLSLEPLVRHALRSAVRSAIAARLPLAFPTDIQP